MAIYSSISCLSGAGSIITGCSGRGFSLIIIVCGSGKPSSGGGGGGGGGGSCGGGSDSASKDMIRLSNIFHLGGYMFNFKREVLVDIKNDDTTLNYQESLVLDQRYRSYERVGMANARLDEKAIGYLQAGGVVIGLVTVFNLFESPRSTSDSICFLIATIIAFASFIIMIVVVNQSLSPRDVHVPGSNEWEDMRDLRLYVPENNCFKQILSDLIKAVNSESELNKFKSKRVIIAGWLLISEILFLLIAVLLSYIPALV